MSEQESLCPNCEARGDKVGAPCKEPICQKKGYHFIPKESFERYQKWLAQPGASEDPEIGRIVDRYLIVEKLGQGGMGAVYLALQVPLMREVALKMASGVILDDVARQRFEREAKSISILYHPNIVGLIDFGFNPTSGVPFMAIEYVKGGRELGDEIARTRSRGEAWTPEALINIFSQILNGLSIAHKSGLIHRDIKPQNIMLVSIEGNPSFVKILDFGLARALVEIPGGSKLTLQGTIMGTPQYMAPEQIVGKGPVDHRCDIYAVGAMFFEMFTSRPLYPAESPRDTFALKMNADYDPLSQLPPGEIPAAIEAVLRKALDREPAQRFTSATEMKDAMVKAVTEVGGLKGRRSEDIGYAQTVQMTLPADLDDAKVSSAETRVEEALPPPPETKEMGSIDAAEEEAPRKAGRPAVTVFLVLVLVAAGGLASYFAYQHFAPMAPSTPLDAFQETSQNSSSGTGNADETAAGGNAESPGPIIDISSFPPVSSNDAQGSHKKDKKTGADEAEAEKEGGEPAEDATTAADVPAEEGAGEEPPALPAKPTQAAVKKVQKELRIAVEKCAASAQGTIEVVLTLVFEGASGEVTQIKESTVSPSEITGCVKQAALGLRVPPFQEASFPVPFEFVLGESAPDEGAPDLGLSPGGQPDKSAAIELKLKKIHGWLVLCANGKQGKVVLEIVADTAAGKLKDASVVGGDFKGTPEAACMEKTVKKLFKFEPFGAREITFKRQFTIE
jgi:serine/threonine protein kinase